MWLTAVLASALVRLATVLTVTGGNDGSGGEGGGEDGGDGGEGGKDGGGGGGGGGGGEGSGDGVDGGGGGGEGGGNGARPGGCGGKDGGGGAWQVRTEPATPVMDVAQEQTVPSSTKILGGCGRGVWGTRGHKGGHKSKASHRGDENFSRSLRPAPPVVDQSICRSCASENQSKRVSHFPIPIGAMGSLQAWLVCTFP